MVRTHPVSSRAHREPNSRGHRHRPTGLGPRGLGLGEGPSPEGGATPQPRRAWGPLAPTAEAPAEPTSVTQPGTHRGQRLTRPLGAGRAPSDGGRQALRLPRSSSVSCGGGDHDASFGIPAAAPLVRLARLAPSLSPVKLSQGPQRKAAAASALRTERQPSATRMEREGKGCWRTGRRARGVERAEGEAGDKGEGRWCRGGWGGAGEGPDGSESPRLRGPARFPGRAPARELFQGSSEPGACAVFC